VPRWKLCYRRIQDPRNFAMVWVQELLQEQKAVFGPDPWPYNLEDNRKALEAVVRYEFEQGMIRKQLRLGHPTGKGDRGSPRQGPNRLRPRRRLTRSPPSAAAPCSTSEL
jgi:hypothetical protein